MCRSALSLNALHSFHPTAAESQCRCCASRKPAGSIALGSMVALPHHPVAVHGDANRSGPGHHTIASVPFTLRNLREDLEDVGSNFDGAPDLEFRLATDALELERSGLGYQRVP